MLPGKQVKCDTKRNVSTDLLSVDIPSLVASATRYVESVFSSAVLRMDLLFLFVFPIRSLEMLFLSFLFLCSRGLTLALNVKRVIRNLGQVVVTMHSDMF